MSEMEFAAKSVTQVNLELHNLAEVIVNENLAEALRLGLNFTEPFYDSGLNRKYQSTEVERFYKKSKLPGVWLSSLNEHMARDVSIKYFGMTIPTWAAIEKLVRYGPFIEVGCGLGYWAYLLRQQGADIIATDHKMPAQSEYHWGNKWGHNTRRWVPNIELWDAQDAAYAHTKRTLLMVWPCYDKPWAANALNAYVGQTVVYVGEGSGGCTADDRFHDMLATDWDPVDEIDSIAWSGSHDHILVYRSRASSGGTRCRWNR